MIKSFLKIIVIALLVGSLGAETSYAAEEQVNISANVPSEDLATSPGGPVPIYDSDPPQISDVQVVDISFDSASIRWKTNENSSAHLYYGKTLSYEIGTLEDHLGNLTYSHKIDIENLQENTVYNFQIRSSDSAGNQSIKDGYNFKTLSQKISLENVSGLNAVAGDATVALSWENPPIADLDKIVISRSEIFYPKNSGEGTILYSGKEESFMDINLLNGKKYYYSVFSFDLKGNISSGAVVSVVPNKAESPEKSPEAAPEKPVTPTEKPSESSPEKPEVPPPPPPEIPPEIEKITIDDYIFLQDGVKINLKDGKIEVDPGREIIVSIDAKNIPEEVGSIMIILTRENEEYSYLMKKDESRGVYSASIKMASSGSFDLTIALLDRDNKIIKVISANVLPISTMKAPKERFSTLTYVFPLLILLLVLIAYKIIKKLSQKRKEKEKPDNNSHKNS